MELRYHSTNKKKQPTHTHTHQGKGKAEEGGRIEKKGQSLIAAAAVKWQHSRQTYGIVKVIEN